MQRKVQLIIVILLLNSLAYGEQNLTYLYQQAVVKAQQQQLASVALPALSHTHDLKLITWTNLPYVRGTQVLKTELWVVGEKALQTICQTFTKKSLPLQITQLLGMPPLTQYQGWHIVVLSAPNRQATITPNNQISAGIYRPCYSTNSLATTQCNYHLNPKTPRYDVWVAKLQQQWHAYPWTGLGYTYNWAPNAHSKIGLAEFVITPGTPITVVKITSPAAFCRTFSSNSRRDVE